MNTPYNNYRYNQVHKSEFKLELTIEQAFQQAVNAHNGGKEQDAERLYRAILQSQPLHPDANHNLGVLAVSVDETDAALLLFKTALKANPEIEKFWFSYINALVKNNELKDAKQAVKKAKKKGFNAKKLQALLSQKNEVAGTNKPSQELITSLFEHYKNGRFDDAEKMAISFTQQFPKHQLSYKILGATLLRIGRLSDALDAGQIAVELSPLDAEAHSNLGVIFKSLGKLEDATASYIQAIKLSPNYTEARVNLSEILPNVRFNASYPQYYPILLNILTTGNYCRPKALAGSFVSLLKHDPLIKKLLRENQFYASVQKAESAIGGLDKLKLLHHVMRLCPLPDIQLEEFFVTMRSFLLMNLKKMRSKYRYSLEFLC